MLSKFTELENINIESSVLKEYAKFKNEDPDSILLFQIGSFYETFFEDAKIFSQVTGATLGTRIFKPKIEVIQSGVNKNSICNFVKKILIEGYKVCICSEFADEEGKHYREITRKFTQGTIIEDEFLDCDKNYFLMAVYYKDNIYNIAYADVSTGQFYKTKTNFKEYKIETDKISPAEILLSEKQKDIFKNITAKYNITYVNEEYFKDNIENAIEKYCKYTQKNFKPKLDKIIEYKPESYMSLDEVTRKNLELTRTNYLSKKKGSILWFLNYTKTSMGLRLLKKFLNEPLLSKTEIQKRQDAVEEFIANPNLLEKTQNILKQFSDISRICARLSNTTVLPKDLLNLVKNSLLLSDLKEIVCNLNSGLLKINNERLDKVLKLANSIKMSVKEDCPNELKSGGIINEGYSAELDYLNKELNELNEQIKKYEISQKKALNIENIQVKYLPSSGYYIEVPSIYALKMPKEYYKKNSTSKSIRFGTEKLQILEESINSVKYKICETEYEIYKKIRLTASDFVETIRLLAHDIALIDVIASFAKSALENNLSKPLIGNNTIHIKNGYHPSLIKLNNEITKNNTELEQGSFIILTGANMSGKSTYLKYNAITCILAQIGSYVPADSAELPVIDKIFFRQSSTDDIINNNSSFMVEMNDLKYIIENATDSSFLLLDEPAKSTNSKEGGVIARAFCEYILNHYKTRAIIATHNMELVKLEEKYSSRVTNYVIGNSHGNNFSNRKIRRGIIDKSHAIDTAILADLPKEIIMAANLYME